MPSPQELAELAKTSPFYAMRLMGEQEAARRGAGAQLYQMYAGPQNPPMAQPAPQPGGGGLPPPPPGTPQGGPMPPQPGANPAPPQMQQQGIPPQQRAGMPPPNPGMMPPGQMPPPPMGGAPGAPPPGGAPGPGAGAPPMQPMQRPLASPKPFQAMPTVPPSGPPQAGQIGAPPAAPQQPDAGLLQPGKQFNLQALVQQLKGSGVPPDKVMDMLDQLTPVMNQQNQQELKMLQAQTSAAKAAEQFYKDRLQIELMGRRLGVQEGAEARRGRQGDTRLDQGQQKIDITKKQLEGGDWTPQDVSFWTKVLQEGGNLPPRLATTPGGKKLLADIMKGAARGDVSPKDMLANQAEFMGEKAGQRTLGTRTANIEMAATEAAGLSSLALKASEEWNRTGIKSLNDLERYAQGRTASPTLRRFVAANTSFINAYARAINPQGVGTVADKEHAREMLEVGFAKGDYAAAIDQLQSEISVAQSSPGQVKKSMRERFVGGGSRSSAPQDALDYLKAHPETSQQFSAKYGYLPAGAR